MNPRQKKVVLAMMALVPVIWIISIFIGSAREPPLLSKAPLLLNASRAYRTTEAFVTQCPQRVFGSLESRSATGFLRDKLESLGYEWDYMNVGAPIKEGKEVGRNILGFKEGISPEIIAIVAHYDTAPATIQGAMDNGSGVGTAIEIARVLAETPTHRSILIAFTDGGEWGLLGAEDLATRYEKRGRIVAVLSLDYVAIGDFTALRLDETGLQQGFTPPWYRLLSFAAAEETGLPVQSPSGFREHLERTFYIPWSDQGPFLASGIPAINLGSRSVESDREEAVYRSPLDTVENLKVSSFESFGFAAERIVRSLDEIPSIPQGSMDSFQVRLGIFKTPGILHTIFFIPLALCIFFIIKNHHSSLKTAGILRELLAYAAILFSLSTIYFMIRIFRFFELLPAYELYPATAGDPVLMHPSWGTVGGILATLLIIGAACTSIYVYCFRKHPRQIYSTSRTVLLCLTLITALAALPYNSYWAVTFLTLPCWIWCFVPGGSNGNRRLMHWICILFAAVPCAFVWHLASRLDLDWKWIWYHILALSTGLFSVRAFFLGASAIAIGLRFIVAQLHEAE